RILDDEVECADRVLLTNPGDATKSLLYHGWSPRHVVVRDEVRELQVDALAPGVSRYQHPRRTAKSFLREGSLAESHGAVARDPTPRARSPSPLHRARVRFRARRMTRPQGVWILA